MAPIKLVDSGVAKAMGRSAKPPAPGSEGVRLHVPAGDGQEGRLPATSSRSIVLLSSPPTALVPRDTTPKDCTCGERKIRRRHDPSYLLPLSTSLKAWHAIRPRFQTAEEFQHAPEIAPQERAHGGPRRRGQLAQEVAGAHGAAPQGDPPALRAIEGAPVDAAGLAPADASHPGADQISAVSVVTDWTD
jgi:hypothetical protein